MRKHNIIAVLLVLLLASSMLSAASILSRPAATVNLIRNEAITTDELDAEYQNYIAQGAQNITKRDVLDVLINNAVFLQGAERDGVTVSDRQVDQLYAQARANASQQAGYSVSDDEFAAEATRQFGSVDAYKKALKEQMILEQYLMQEKGSELQNIPQPSEGEIASFYRQNQQGFFQAENVKLAHIYIPKSDDEAKNAESMELLQSVAADIKAGNITFEKAVAQYSEDESSKNIGGDIGWLTADNTIARQGWGDAFCDQVLSMEPGDVSDALESNTGYHIVKVSVHNDAKILSLSDPVSPEESTTIHDYIAQLLYMRNYQIAMNNALNEMVAELRSEAQINILYEE